MKTTLPPALLLLSLSFGSCTVFEKNADEVFAQDAIVAELDHYYADLNKRDWKAFAEHFWPEAIIATMWTPPGETQERASPVSVTEYIAQVKKGPSSKPIFEERLIDYKVHINGGIAHVWARCNVRYGETGNITDWTRIDSFSLMRTHDDRWRIMSLTFAPEHPPSQAVGLAGGAPLGILAF